MTFSDELLDKSEFVCVLKDSYGSFVYWNAALVNAFPIPPDGMNGKTEYHFMSDSDAAAIRQNDQQVLRTGKDLSALEFVILPSGKRTCWLVKKFRVRTRSHKYLGVIAKRVDIDGSYSDADVEQCEAILEPVTVPLRERMAALVESGKIE